MMPPLPEPWDTLCRPLFSRLSVNAAMAHLVVAASRQDESHALVERITADARLRDKPLLAAGLWLYVDDLHASHRISQQVDTPDGAFWHAIMHRREGDFDNCRHWYRHVGSHPVFARVDISGGSGGAGTDVGEFDPFEFVDHVEAAHRRRQAAPELVALQRREWIALFHHCAER